MRSARSIRPSSPALQLIALVGLVGLAGVVACSPSASSSDVPITNRIVIGGGSPPPPASGSADGPPDVAPNEPRTDPAPDASGPPIPPLDPGVRDSRAKRLRPRGSALLISEIQLLERLFASTSSESPDRPKLIRRLAEAYVELESEADREPRAAASQTGMERFLTIRDAARLSAIKYYQKLRSDYPKYCDAPAAPQPAGSAGCLDEVLYYMGYEFELLHQLDNARKVYFELIKNYPASPFVPYVYFAFGEAFLEEARSDPAKWGIAAQAYIKVTEMKNSPIAPYATSRIALICERAPKDQALPSVCASAGRGDPAANGGGGDE